MNKGFGLNELIIFLVLFVIILIATSIALSKTFDKMSTQEPQVKNDEPIENKIIVSDKTNDIYSQIKTKMENATKIYLDENKNLKKEQAIIRLSTLINKKYMEQIIDPENDKKLCDGYVIYNGNEDYDTYLKCSDYESKNYNINLE